MQELEYGLIGRTLAHSCSLELHALLRDYSYALIELEPHELEPFVRAKGFRGLNVTIPYKQDVFALCDTLSECAKKIGAVNTVIKRSDGSLFGDNTDYAGFVYMCKRAKISFGGESVLILGSGGTSRTAQCVVKDMGAKEIIVISRSGRYTYSDLPRFRHCTRIINTTPLGMYPHAAETPLKQGLAELPNCGGVVDVIYNPLRTRLLQDADDLDIPYTNGLSMLAAQAKYSSDLFTGSAIPERGIEAALEALLQERQNIALIGMPGCGKSTVGKLLAERLDLCFVDVDSKIEMRAEKKIPDIFFCGGEDLFRKLESEVLEDICSRGGQVISTGGGAVLRPQNRAALRSNSRVIWLQRDLSRLAVRGRPLSGDAASLVRLWNEREPLYRSAADLTVINNTDDPKRCVEECCAPHNKSTAP